MYNIGNLNYPLNNVYTGTINVWDLQTQDTPYFVSYQPGTGKFGYTVAGTTNQFIYNTGTGLAGSEKLTTVSGYTVIGTFIPPTVQSDIVYLNKFNVSAYPDGLEFPEVNTISGVFTDVGYYQYPFINKYVIDPSLGMVLPDGAYMYYQFVFTCSSTFPDIVECTFTIGVNQQQYKTTALNFYDISDVLAYSFYYQTVKYGNPYLYIINRKTNETLYESIRYTAGPTVLSVTRTNQFISFSESGQIILSEAVFDLGSTCKIDAVDQGNFGSASFITDFTVKRLSGFPVTNTLAIGGDVTPLVNNEYNIGAPGYSFNTIYGDKINITDTATMSAVVISGPITLCALPIITDMTGFYNTVYNPTTGQLAYYAPE